MLQEVTETPYAGAGSHLMLGIALYQSRDLTGAQKAYTKAIQLDPARPEPYQGLANIFRDKGDLANAEIWYRKAWQADTHYVEAYSELALQLHLSNNPVGAIRVLEEGVKNIPQPTDLHLFLADLHARQGNRKRAVELLNAVTAADPGNTVARQALHQLNADSGSR